MSSSPPPDSTRVGLACAEDTCVACGTTQDLTYRPLSALTLEAQDQAVSAWFDRELDDDTFMVEQLLPVPQDSGEFDVEWEDIPVAVCRKHLGSVLSN